MIDKREFNITARPGFLFSLLDVDGDGRITKSSTPDSMSSTPTAMATSRGRSSTAPRGLRSTSSTRTAMA
jgi:hypothetical protein